MFRRLRRCGRVARGGLQPCRQSAVTGADRAHTLSKRCENGALRHRPKRNRKRAFCPRCDFGATQLWIFDNETAWLAFGRHAIEAIGCSSYHCMGDDTFTHPVHE